MNKALADAASAAPSSSDIMGSPGSTAGGSTPPCSPSRPDESMCDHYDLCNDEPAPMVVVSDEVVPMCAVSTAATSTVAGDSVVAGEAITNMEASLSARATAARAAVSASAGAVAQESPTATTAAATTAAATTAAATTATATTAAGATAVGGASPVATSAAAPAGKVQIVRTQRDQLAVGLQAMAPAPSAWNRRSVPSASEWLELERSVAARKQSKAALEHKTRQGAAVAGRGIVGGAAASKQSGATLAVPTPSVPPATPALAAPNDAPASASSLRVRPVPISSAVAAAAAAAIAASASDAADCRFGEGRKEERNAGERNADAYAAMLREAQGAKDIAAGATCAAGFSCQFSEIGHGADRGAAAFSGFSAAGTGSSMAPVPRAAKSEPQVLPPP